MAPEVISRLPYNQAVKSVFCKLSTDICICGLLMAMTYYLCYPLHLIAAVWHSVRTAALFYSVNHGQNMLVSGIITFEKKSFMFTVNWTYLPSLLWCCWLSNSKGCKNSCCNNSQKFNNFRKIAWLNRKLKVLIVMVDVVVHCGPVKMTPFYYCNNLVYCQPALIFFDVYTL